MSKDEKLQAHSQSRSRRNICREDATLDPAINWDKVRSRVWTSSFSEAPATQNEKNDIGGETSFSETQLQGPYRLWLGNFANSGSDKVLGKLFAVGCDIFFLMQFTYFYCSPDADPLDEWARKARSLRSALPDYLKKIKKLSKALGRLETSDRMQLLGNTLDPVAPRLERYAQNLEVAMKTLKEAGIRGSMRPFYLLCMSYYLRMAYPDRGRGTWMNKAIHADIRDLINAGFRAFEIDRDLSEDQVRRLCERFSKGYPEFAKAAEDYAKKLPSKGIHVLEKLYQDMF